MTAKIGPIAAQFVTVPKPEPKKAPKKASKKGKK